MIPPFDTHPFRRSLLTWFRKNARDLPWRHTRDPYAIMVSEFMLQQTQVATVLPYYNKWLRRFPDFATLAAASENDVLHAWQGLGYYARARNLHAAAKIVQDRHRGIFPRDLDSIGKLPGIGRYTAHAIATFAFDQSVPIVEANTARLLARLFNLRHVEALWTAAASLLPRQNAARLNSALIDLGALVCTARKPRCEICPVKKFCRAPGIQIKKSRPPIKKLNETHALVVNGKRILLERCTRRWRGMWILPPHQIVDCLKQSMALGAIYVSVFPFTHHRITLQVFRARPRKIDKEHQRWFSRAELAAIPIPSPHRRALSALLH